MMSRRRTLLWVTLILVQVASHQCYGIKGSAALDEFRRQQLLKAGFHHAFAAENSGKRTEMLGTSARLQPGHACPGDGLKEDDKIDRLPGQPDGVDFNQYSGYGTANSKTGKAFFYYFVESSKNASSKPLVLWFSGGVSCSSFGVGALTEIGPFRVNQDTKTLHLNPHAWNKVIILFVEFAAGLGFSYSNTTSDYKDYGDAIAAEDTYSFLINWLKRFPEYKKADVFLVGEGYSGHNAIQLSRLILQKSKHACIRNKINLKVVALGNAFIDQESDFQGSIDYEWSHAIISDEIYLGLKSNCNLSKPFSQKCNEFLDKRNNLILVINLFDIYSPLRTPGSNPYRYAGPYSTDYVQEYIGNRNVQIALHAINAADHAPYPWKLCSYGNEWNDFPNTVLPIISELMEGGIKVLVYSGDVSDYITVTAARYAINKLGLSVVTPWYPWYYHNEVGGYAVGYENLVFASVRGAGQYVPASQPGRALELFSSFLNGNLPPSK